MLGSIRLPVLLSARPSISSLKPKQSINNPQVWNKECSIRLHVCNYFACADTLADAVNRLLINDATGYYFQTFDQRLQYFHGLKWLAILAVNLKLVIKYLNT